MEEWKNWKDFYQYMDNALEDGDVKALILKTIKEGELIKLKDLSLFLNLEKTLAKTNPKVVEKAINFVKLIRQYN
ncbi:hypothetical protein J4476_05055 [Candidatus Woesearchaeota archaeon]|nr:MAG: hypothetical protein QT09_C0004G0076 [archaeon GW2011_AR18]MBS3162032.1 hypothetical protein [Candidatus Woesearchaeota archaeon]HIH25929.1 hypothetical protein [Nanoarchaeota archaeon]